MEQAMFLAGYYVVGSKIELAPPVPEPFKCVARRGKRRISND
jgi:hypothetical protein